MFNVSLLTYKGFYKNAPLSYSFHNLNPINSVSCYKLSEASGSALCIQYALRYARLTRDTTRDVAYRTIETLICKRFTTCFLCHVKVCTYLYMK